jgi:hypothetical protein
MSMKLVREVRGREWEAEGRGEVGMVDVGKGEKAGRRTKVKEEKKEKRWTWSRTSTKWKYVEGGRRTNSKEMEDEEKDKEVVLER